MRTLQTSKTSPGSGQASWRERKMQLESRAPAAEDVPASPSNATPECEARRPTESVHHKPGSGDGCFPIVCESVGDPVRLLDGERRLEDLTDALPQAVFETDHTLCLTFANRTTLATFGYTRSDLGARLHISQLLPADEWARAEADARRVLQGEAVGANEYNFRKRDGSTFPGILYARPLVHKGEVVGVRGSVVDVGERKRVEKTLRESEERYRQLVDLSPDAIFVHVEGRIVFANAMAARLAGVRSPAELMGRDIFTLIHPDYREAVRLRLRRIAETGGRVPPQEQKYIRVDGTVVDVEATAVATTFDGRPAVQAVVRDITDRKAAQRSLQESEKRYRQLVELSPEPIFVHSNWRLVYANPAAVNLFAAGDKQALIGKPILDLIHPDHREQARERIYRMLSERTRLPLVQQRYLRLDGSTVEVEVAAVPTTFDGQPAVQVMAKDISYYRQAEERISREAARAHALAQVAARCNARLDLSAVLAAVCEGATEALHAQAACVCLGADCGSLALAASFGLGAAQWEGYLSAWRQSAAWSTGKSPAFVLLTGAAAPIMLAVAAMRRDERVVGELYVVGGNLSLPPDDEDLRLLQGIADQAALAIENARLFAEAERLVARMQALRSIDAAITTNTDLRATLDIVLERVTEALGVDAAAVLLYRRDAQTLEYAAGRGLRAPNADHEPARPGSRLARQAVDERRLVVVSDLDEVEARADPLSSLRQEGFRSYLAAPLIAKGQVRGVLEILHRSRLSPNEDCQQFLLTLAAQAAIAIDNATLFVDLERTNAELTHAYDATIEGWSRALELRDRETEGHTVRVTELTERLARALGVAEAEIVHIRRGALLHDIGKLGVPDSILLKPGPLTKAERQIMRLHAVYGYDLLSSIDFLRQAAVIPYCHHERWDGTGYPRGLKGEEIPFPARIFAVADVWDALRSDRPYRPAWPARKAREYISKRAGRHFDPQVVLAFLTLVNEEEATAGCSAPADRPGRWRQRIGLVCGLGVL